MRSATNAVTARPGKTSSRRSTGDSRSWAVLLGLVLGGIIDYFVPDCFVVRLLGGDSRLTLINAVLAGFLMSACSHGILAIAIQLYKKGASVPAVITFLLASPWANLPMTVLLFGFSASRRCCSSAAPW